MSNKNKKTKKCKECGEIKNINEFKKNKNTKDGYVSVCNLCLNKKSMATRSAKNYNNFYVYRFLDKNDNIIYVGKTNNIYSRIYNHINIAISIKQNENQFLMYPNIYKIEYSDVESDYHMNIYEIHYICKYNPPFNDNFKSNNTNLFDLPKLIWNPFVFKSFIDDVQTYYWIKNGKDAINVKKEFKNNINFYNEIIEEYLSSNYIYKQFHQNLFSNLDFCLDEENIIFEDELDYCKNDCDIESDDKCINCKNKITWRDYYDNRIKESKLKFTQQEECI